MENIDDQESVVKEFYGEKNESYFQGARKDYVMELPDNPDAIILEIGCSNGNTGAFALAENKCKQYVGVEIHEEAAEKAKHKLSQVIIGNIEEMDLPLEENSIDALILSEVLEHLVDPWKVLVKLKRYLKPGALVFASSPNVSHYRIIRMIIKGEWNLTDQGVMDRTHLRWFTPKSFADMFEDSGYKVIKVEALPPLRSSTKLKIALMFGRAKHLFYNQISIKAKA